MLKVVAEITKEYSFTDEAEEKIKKRAKEHCCSFEDAIYDLIDMGELDLELDSWWEDTDDPNIIEVTEI